MELYRSQRIHLDRMHGLERLDATTGCLLSTVWHLISGKPFCFSNSPDYVPSKFTFRPASTARQSDEILRYE